MDAVHAVECIFFLAAPGALTTSPMVATRISAKRLSASASCQPLHLCVRRVLAGAGSGGDRRPAGWGGGSREYAVFEI